MLPPSLPSRHFVFHPVDINNMASYDNEKGTIFYRARLLLASRCIPIFPGYGTAFYIGSVAGLWLPIYATVSNSPNASVPRNGSRILHLASRIPDASCTVSIVP